MKLHPLRAAFLVICFLVCSQGKGGYDLSSQEILLQDNLQLALDFNTLVAPGQTLAEEPLSPSTCSWGQFASDTGYHIRRGHDRSISWDGPWVYLADDNGNSFDLRLENFKFPITAWAGSIYCAGFPGVGPVGMWIDGWMGFSTMRLAGTWEFTTGNAGPEASIKSLDVNTGGPYLDLVVPASFDFFADVAANIVIPAVQNLAEDAFEDTLRSQLQVLVPEPTTLSLLAMSLLFAGRRWR